MKVFVACVSSFVHLDDAAAATVAAIERGAPGVYNIVDDEPAPVNVRLPELARLRAPGRHCASPSGSAASSPGMWASR